MVMDANEMLYRIINKYEDENTEARKEFEKNWDIFTRSPEFWFAGMTRYNKHLLDIQEQLNSDKHEIDMRSFGLDKDICLETRDREKLSLLVEFFLNVYHSING